MSIQCKVDWCAKMSDINEKKLDSIEEEYDDGTEPTEYDRIEIRFDRDLLFVKYREVCESIQIVCVVK
jgi:hypothetical protein